MRGGWGPASVVAAAIAAMPVLARADDERHVGATIVDVVIDHPAQIAELVAHGIEPLADHPWPPVVRVHVPADARAWLDASGRSYVVRVADLPAAIASERARLRAREQLADMFADFRDLDEIHAHLEWLVTQADPAVLAVQTVSLGISIEGRTIEGLRVGRPDDGDRPRVIVNATQHAREWIATMAALFVADALVTRDDPTIAAVLDATTVIVVPVVNPDGYVYTWQVDRLWRKNRRDDHGVDLNRNFGVGWGGEGSSGNPQSNNYRGTEPFSEPEAVAIRKLFEDEPHVVAHVDVHSFGQLVLSPWGWGYAAPPAEAVLVPLAAQIADAMAFSGTTYTPLQGAEFYPASGNVMDYSYGTHGVHAFGLELVPDEVEIVRTGFLVEPDAIVPTGEELLAGVLTLAAFVADADPLAPGDDGDAPGPPAATTGDDDTMATTGTPPDADTTTTDTGSEVLTSGSIADGESSTSAPPVSPDARIDEVSSSCACVVPRTGHDNWPLFVLWIGRLARRRRQTARPPQQS